MKRLQHGPRVAFGDAEEGAGGAFGATVALLPVLQGARADAMNAANWLWLRPSFSRTARRRASRAWFCGRLSFCHAGWRRLL